MYTFDLISPNLIYILAKTQDPLKIKQNVYQGILVKEKLNWIKKKIDFKIAHFLTFELQISRL